jgi:NADH-quinone oxidoreductase subunit N
MNTIIAITLLGVITLFLGIFDLKRLLLPVIISGLIVTLGLTISDWGPETYYFGNMFFTDKFYLSFAVLMILATIVTFLIAAQYYKDDTRSLEGIYAIILFSLVGGLIMISSGNLATFFIGLEILSISLYLLAGSHKTSSFSNEAAMKYFLMGSFASAFLLFGIALVYGATGSLYNKDIALFINLHGFSSNSLLKTGVFLVSVGMAFKVAAVPFHFWAPDVYHGSPTLITSYMVTVVKAAGFAAFLRLTTTCFGIDSTIWTTNITIIAALSIIVGNVGALTQTRMKRMLAYSSIAHTGYILLAILAAQGAASEALLYYSIGYILSNLSAFIVVIMVKKSVNNSDIASFNGLAKINPIVALCASISFLSLAGIPPLAGFMAKYIVFTTALSYGYVWLVVIAILGSVISIFYYFRPIINMYMKEPDFKQLETSKLSIAVLIILTILTVVVGFIPGIVLTLLKV